MCVYVCANMHGGVVYRKKQTTASSQNHLLFFLFYSLVSFVLRLALLLEVVINDITAVLKLESLI